MLLLILHRYSASSPGIQANIQRNVPQSVALSDLCFVAGEPSFLCRILVELLRTKSTRGLEYTEEW
jgi:hypothetical protein